MTQKEEHVLDPASAVARVPLKLTKRFTEKLNHDGSVERSESQEISVTNGTARMPSFESINAIFGVRGNPTQGVTPKVKVMDEVERFLQGMPSDERSEEHTSELQSLMRISYAAFCLKKQILTTLPTILTGFSHPHVTPHSIITCQTNCTCRSA